MATHSKDVTRALEEQIFSFVTGDSAEGVTGFGLPADAAAQLSLQVNGAGAQPSQPARPSRDELKLYMQNRRREQEKNAPAVQKTKPVDDKGLFEAIFDTAVDRVETIASSLVFPTAGYVASTAADAATAIGGEDNAVADWLNSVSEASYGINTSVRLENQAEAYEFTPLSEIKQDWGEGAYGELVKDVGLYAFEKLATSIPDIAFLLTNMPAYMLARTNEIATDRAAADGRDKPQAEDVVIAAPTAIVVSLLDRLGIAQALRPLKGNAAARLIQSGVDKIFEGGAVKRAIAVGLSETGTEVIQEGLENVAGTAGTKAGFKWNDFQDALLGAALAGGPGGAVIGALHPGASSGALPTDTTEDNGPALPTGVPVDAPVDAPEENAPVATEANVIGEAERQALGESIDQAAEEPTAGAIPTVPTVPAENIAAPVTEPVAAPTPVAAAPVTAPQPTPVATPATPSAGPVAQSQPQGVATTTVAPEAVAPTPIVGPVPTVIEDTATLVEPLVSIITPSNPEVRTAARDVMRALSSVEDTGTVEERQRLGRRGAVLTKEGVTDFGKATELLAEYIPQLEELAPGLVEAIQQQDTVLVAEKLNAATEALTGVKPTVKYEGPTTVDANETAFDGLRFTLEQVTTAEAKGTKIKDQLESVLNLALALVGRKNTDGTRSRSVMSELQDAGDNKTAGALARAAAKAMPRKANTDRRITIADMESQLRRANEKQGGKGYNIPKPKLMQIKAGLRAAAELALKKEPTRKVVKKGTKKIEPKAEAKTKTTEVVKEAKPAKSEAKTSPAPATKAEQAKEASKKRTEAKKKGSKKDSKAEAKTADRGVTETPTTKEAEAKPKFEKLSSEGMDVVRQLNEHSNHRSLMKMYSLAQLRQFAGKLGLLRAGKKGDLAIRIFNFVKLGTSNRKILAPKAIAASENEVRAKLKATKEKADKRKKGREGELSRLKKLFGLPVVSMQQFLTKMKKDHGSYIYHAVFNESDIPSILKNGLRAGSNVSLDTKGQAFDEDVTILVFKREDIKYKVKEYQNDGLTTNTPKPVMIIRETSIAEQNALDAIETPKAVAKAYDDFSVAFDAMQNKIKAFAEVLGITFEQLNDLVLDRKLARDKPDYKALIEGDLVRTKRYNRLVVEYKSLEREIERIEKQDPDMQAIVAEVDAELSQPVVEPKQKAADDRRVERERERERTAVAKDAPLQKRLAKFGLSFNQLATEIKAFWEKRGEAYTEKDVVDMSTINPKVVQLVLALNEAGIRTQMAGDLYGNKIMYVDLLHQPMDGVVLPPGWIFAGFNANDTIAALTGPEKSRIAIDKSEAGYRQRLARAGSKPVTEAEANAIAAAIKNASTKPKAAEEAKTVSKARTGKKAVVGTRKPIAVTPTGNPLKAMAAEYFGYELDSKDKLKWAEFKEAIGDNAADAVRWLTGFTQAFKDKAKSTDDVTIMQKGWDKIWNAGQDVINATPDKKADALATLVGVLEDVSTVSGEARTGFVDAVDLLHQARQTRLAEQALDIAEPADIIAELESQAGTDPVAQTELAILVEQQEQARVADEMGELAPDDFLTDTEAAAIAEQTSAVVDEEETYSELGDQFDLEDSIDAEGEFTGKGELKFMRGALDDQNSFRLTLKAKRVISNILQSAVIRGNGLPEVTSAAIFIAIEKYMPPGHPLVELAKGLGKNYGSRRVVNVKLRTRKQITARIGDASEGTLGFFDLGQRISPIKAIDENGRESVVGQAVYAPNSDAIVILDELLNNPAKFVKVFMHEYIHSATYGAYRTDDVFRRKMDRLFMQVQFKFIEQHPDSVSFMGDSGDFYGFQDTAEFISEAFANPAFQEILSSINMGLRNGKEFTAWDKFKRAVWDILGLDKPNENYSAFDLAMETIKLDDALTIQARTGAAVSASYSITPAIVRDIGKPIGRKAQQRQFDKSRDIALRKAAGRWKQARNKFLNLQTVDQIIRRHADKFEVLSNAAKQINPMRGWYKANLDRIKIARRIHHEARDHVRRFNKFDEASKAPFQQLMLDTTLWSVYPDKDINDAAHDHLRNKKGNIKQEVMKQHAKQVAAWAKMKAPEKQLYLDMVESGAKVRDMTIAALMGRVSTRFGINENPEVLDKFLKIKTNEEFDKLIIEHASDIPALADVEATTKSILNSLNVHGPYLPVRRYGKYVSSARRDESMQFATEADAQTAADAWTVAERVNTAKISGVVVTFKGRVYAEHQTLSEAQEARDEYIRLGYDPETADANRKVQSTLATAAGLTTLMRQLNKTVKNKALQGQLDNAISELLAENVNQASKLRRANVPGARPEDMMRGYAERMYGAGWNIGDVQTSFAMDESMNEMEGLTRAGNVIETTPASEDTLLRRRDLYNHILKLEDTTLRDRNSSGVNRFLGGTGFLWYLASPSYSFINATQVPLITLPYLASKHGLVKTTIELKNMYKTVLPQLIKGIWESKVGFTGTEEAVFDNVRRVLEKQGYGDAFKKLTDLNVIDSTFIQELVDTVNGMRTTGRAKKGADYIMQVARTLPLSIETLNRVVTGMAAYKMAKGSEAQRVQAAAEAIRETQFDYSIFNRPHWFKAVPASRALMMFKMYPQGVYSLLTTGIQGLAKTGHRAEAAKLLTGILTTHTLAAGVLGGIMLEPIRLILSALPDGWIDWEDDESFEGWARKVATEELGLTPAQAEVLLKGVPNMAGVDLYSRLGLHNLVTMQAPDLEDKRGFMETMISLGGPIAQIPMRLFDAKESVVDNGDWAKAVQQAAPIAAVRQVTKALRLSDQGMVDYNGNLLVDKNKFDWKKLMLTSLGFQPSLVSETYEARRDVLGKERAVDERRSKILRQMRMAKTPKERREARRQQRRFNLSVPFERRIMQRDISMSRRMQRKRERETRKGVYTKYRSSRQELERYNLPD